jgi:hypothetical protein
MCDGLVPVRDLILRVVPDCEQRHVPDFPTLLCVTRSGFPELQEHTVVGEKYKWAQEPKKRKARAGIPDGPFVEKG